jgi:hypothetical protein
MPLAFSLPPFSDKPKHMASNTHTNAPSAFEDDGNVLV